MLTDTEIRTKGKPKAKPFKLSDHDGLYLLINPSGSRLWRYRQYLGGKEKLHALGAYPAISLKQAREERDRIKRDGPKDKANTFEAVARRAIAEMAENRCDRHEVYSLRRLTEAFAAFGSTPLAELTPKQIADVLEALIARGAPSMAAKVKTLVAQTYRYAAKKGLCDRNPTVLLEVELPASKRRPAVALKDIPALMRSIDGYGGHPVTKHALQLLMRTWLRVEELLGAEWSEIDMAAAVWTVPLARMKKKKRRDDHVVPLSKQALAILEQLHAINGDKRFIFASGRKNQPLSKNTPLYALYRLGYHQEMCSHGFRSIASTLLNETYAAGFHSFGPDIVEFQLAHQHDNEVRLAYNRSRYLKPRTEMMQLYSDYLDNIGDILEKLGPNSNGK